MTKPDFSPTQLEGLKEGWDAVLDANFALVRYVLGGQMSSGDFPESTPRPITWYPDLAALGAVPLATNERALALVGTGDAMRLYMGNVVTGWVQIPIMSPDTVALLAVWWGEIFPNNTIDAIPNPANGPATADALRDDLVNNVLPVIRSNFVELGTKLHTMIVVARNASLIST